MGCVRVWIPVRVGLRVGLRVRHRVDVRVSLRVELLVSFAMKGLEGFKKNGEMVKSRGRT